MVQDEETGTWYQHRGTDFKVPLVDYLLDDSNVVGARRGFNIWPGCRNHNMLWFMFFCQCLLLWFFYHREFMFHIH